MDLLAQTWTKIKRFNFSSIKGSRCKRRRFLEEYFGIKIFVMNVFAPRVHINLYEKKCLERELIRPSRSKGPKTL